MTENSDRARQLWDLLKQLTDNPAEQMAAVTVLSAVAIAYNAGRGIMAPSRETIYDFLCERIKVNLDRLS